MSWSEELNASSSSSSSSFCGDFAGTCDELTAEDVWGVELREQAARLGLAALVGALVGLQREFGYAITMKCSSGPDAGDLGVYKKARGVAGLRTHMLVAISSCLFTIVSQHGFTKAIPFSAHPNAGDPARIAAQ